MPKKKPLKLEILAMKLKRIKKIRKLFDSLCKLDIQYITQKPKKLSKLTYLRKRTELKKLFRTKKF